MLIQNVWVELISVVLSFPFGLVCEPNPLQVVWRDVEEAEGLRRGTWSVNSNFDDKIFGKKIKILTQI